MRLGEMMGLLCQVVITKFVITKFVITEFVLTKLSFLICILQISFTQFVITKFVVPNFIYQKSARLLWGMPRDLSILNLLYINWKGGVQINLMEALLIMLFANILLSSNLR